MFFKTGRRRRPSSFVPPHTHLVPRACFFPLISHEEEDESKLVPRGVGDGAWECNGGQSSGKASFEGEYFFFL